VETDFLFIVGDLDL